MKATCGRIRPHHTNAWFGSVDEHPSFQSLFAGPSIAKFAVWGPNESVSVDCCSAVPWSARFATKILF